MITRNNHQGDSGNRGLEALLLNQRGSTVIMVVVTIVALFAFAMIAIDGAILMTAKAQLQSAADSAALAGASGLIEGSEDIAVERAVNYSSYNRAVEDMQNPVIITPGDVSFPEPDVCRVRTHRTEGTGDPLRVYFLRVLGGGTTANMTAVAAARAYDVCSSECLRPWAIPDRWDDTNGDGFWEEGETYDPEGTGYVVPRDVGADVVLKVGNPQQAISSGIFYPINFPPLDNPDGMKPLTGGSWYRTWIAECEPYLVGVGDRLQLEPGNMVGPTTHGMEELIAQDPGAYWDPADKTVKNSAFGRSPRIGLVPFFDPTLPPESGRNWITVTKIGAFFIESVGPGSEVRGKFIQITTQGQECEGGMGSSFVKGIVLIE
ncbi:MAG: hypothetical protein JSW58_14075 [Candidatus Latescibacterota bacterium]|nr:MAG: hypothetical protein JSW58_14075 [Candidatus Latescibacterota bacterium]